MKIDKDFSLNKFLTSFSSRKHNQTFLIYSLFNSAHSLVAMHKRRSQTYPFVFSYTVENPRTNTHSSSSPFHKQKLNKNNKSLLLSPSSSRQKTSRRREEKVLGILELMGYKLAWEAGENLWANWK